jgi:hypothetical protein
MTDIGNCGSCRYWDAEKVIEPEGEDDIPWQSGSCMRFGLPLSQLPEKSACWQYSHEAAKNSSAWIEGYFADDSVTFKTESTFSCSEWQAKIE